MNPKVKWCVIRTGGGKADAMCALDGEPNSVRQNIDKQVALKTVAYMQPMFKAFTYQAVKYNRRMT